MSQFFGAGNEKGMKQSLLFKFILAFIGIGIYMFCCMGIPYQILSLMVKNNKDAGAILAVGTQYMFIMGFAGIPSTICAVLSSALREIGDVKPPLVISACATFLNTFLDWVFKSSTTSSTGGLILALQRAMLLLAPKGGIARFLTGPLYSGTA